MPESLTLGKAIETLSRLGNELRRHDDQEVTDAVVLVLNELVAIRGQLSRFGITITDTQALSSARQSYYRSQASKDGFPGYPAE